MDIERIVRRREPALRAVLRPVYALLPVLYPDAHGKRLRLHGNSGGIQHFKCIARGVAYRKYKALAFKLILSVRSLDLYASQGVIFGDEPREL